MEHEPDKCDVATIPEEMLQNAEVKAINDVLGSGDTLMPTFQKNIETVIAPNKSTMIEDIDVRLKVLSKELIRQVNGKENYNEVAEEKYHLRELRRDLVANTAERGGGRNNVLARWAHFCMRRWKNPSVR